MNPLGKWCALVGLSIASQFAMGQADSTASCACPEYCCITDPTPSGIMISHIHTKNQWMVSYRYMSMNMSGMQTGTNSVSDYSVFNNYTMSASKMRMDMHMLMAMYGLTNRITLMGMLNYNSNSMQMSAFTGASTMVMDGVVMSTGGMDMSMKSSGLGDLKLSALYGLINKPKHHVLLSAGISVPLGSIHVKGGSNSMYPNHRMPYDMQLGSGTWDVLPAINYLYLNGKLTFSSQVIATVRTNYNSVGYKLGNEATFNNWLAFQWSRHFSSSVRLEGTTSGMIQGRDATIDPYDEPAANPKNYGGQRVSGFIGTNYYFRSGFLKTTKIGAEYGIPFYQNLNGPQMSVKSSLYISGTVMF